MPEPLHGLTVLVTRPAHQARHFQQLLTDAGAQALLFPVIVEGPWANPRITPDLQAALSDPSQLVDRLKDVKDLKDIPIIKDRKARTDALRGLLGR